MYSKRLQLSACFVNQRDCNRGLAVVKEEERIFLDSSLAFNEPKQLWGPETVLQA
jgi:hypothetical protein